MKKNLFCVVLVGGILIFSTFAIPVFAWSFYGYFTWDLESAREKYIAAEGDKLGCLWGKYRSGNGMWECTEPPCKNYNIDGLDCIREGYTGKIFVFPPMTDYNTVYYVCEGYGRVALSCVDYYNNPHEFYEAMNEKVGE